MKLAEYTAEDIQEISMIDLAYTILEESKEPVNFFDLLQMVTKYKGLSEDEVKQRIAQFYTALNIDGRFLSNGDSRWGLKTWFPVEQIEEEITSTLRKKRRAALDDAEEEDIDFDLDDEDADIDEVDEFDTIDDENFDEVSDDEDFIDEDILDEEDEEFLEEDEEEEEEEE